MTKNLATLSNDMPSESYNNFLIIRLIAASLVVYGHAFALSMPCNNCIDLISYYFGFRYSGDVGLYILFFISGYLITISYQIRNNIYSFLKSRILRIYPALFVFILVCLTVGYILSSNHYLFYKNSAKFFVYNTTLYDIVFTMPGVSFNPYSNNSALNGTMWTLPTEIRFYLIVSVIGFIGILKDKNKFLIFSLFLVFLCFFYPNYFPLFGNNTDSFRIGSFFLSGSAVAVIRKSIKISIGFSIILWFITFLSKNLISYEILFSISMCYTTIVIAYSRKIKLPSFVQDYSYGIYLYGWLIEQVISREIPNIGPYKLFIFSLPLSWIAGYISWNIVEKRALKLKKLEFTHILYCKKRSMLL